jgi:hypothetical protein
MLNPAEEKSNARLIFSKTKDELWERIRPYIEVPSSLQMHYYFYLVFSDTFFRGIRLLFPHTKLVPVYPRIGSGLAYIYMLRFQRKLCGKQKLCDVLATTENTNDEALMNMIIEQIKKGNFLYTHLPYSTAALIVKIGVEKFCGCETANE